MSASSCPYFVNLTSRWIILCASPRVHHPDCAPSFVAVGKDVLAGQLISAASAPASIAL